MQPGATFEPAFDSSNRMVVGYNSYLGAGQLNAPGDRKVGVYENPQDPLSPTEPSYYLNDYGAMPFSMTFDADDNLYVAYLNHARVFLYNRPTVGSAPVGGAAVLSRVDVPPSSGRPAWVIPVTGAGVIFAVLLLVYRRRRSN